MMSTPTTDRFSADYSKQLGLGRGLFCFFSHLFFFLAILFSDLFCSKDPNFAHISPSSQTFVTALLEYFVNGACFIGAFVAGDCSIRVS